MDDIALGLNKSAAQSGFRLSDGHTVAYSSSEWPAMLVSAKVVRGTETIGVGTWGTGNGGNSPIVALNDVARTYPRSTDRRLGCGLSW